MFFFSRLSLSRFNTPCPWRDACCATWNCGRSAFSPSKVHYSLNQKHIYQGHNQSLKAQPQKYICWGQNQSWKYIFPRVKIKDFLPHPSTFPRGCQNGRRSQSSSLCCKKVASFHAKKNNINQSTIMVGCKSLPRHFFRFQKLELLHILYHRLNHLRGHWR